MPALPSFDSILTIISTVIAGVGVGVIALGALVSLRGQVICME